VDGDRRIVQAAAPEKVRLHGRRSRTSLASPHACSRQAPLIDATNKLLARKGFTSNYNRMTLTLIQLGVVTCALVHYACRQAWHCNERGSCTPQRLHANMLQRRVQMPHTLDRTLAVDVVNRRHATVTPARQP
jgi:hypothetical protein